VSITTSDCLTERHLMLFGTIVHWFARYEVLMQQIIATVIGSHLADVMLLTRPHTHKGFRFAGECDSNFLKEFGHGSLRTDGV
jgi:hypothetical protein